MLHLCMMLYQHCADTLSNVTINRPGQNFDWFIELVSSQTQLQALRILYLFIYFY